MQNPNKINETFRVINASIAIAVGLVGLSSCSETKLAPSDRYESDYTGVSKYGCLRNSPYKPSNVLITQDEAGNITVTPIVGEIPPLRFDGYENQDQPLQPIDQHTKDVMENYGCTTAYGN